MDNNKIFIDTDTEITFIIEKILNSRTEKVSLVVPDRASLLTSITGLKLIKRVIDKSNKLLILVTLDEQGAELARKAGLIVVSRIGEVNDKVWDVVQKAKFEVIKKSKAQHHYMPEILETPNSHPHFSSNLTEKEEKVEEPKEEYKEEIKSNEETKSDTEETTSTEVPLVRIRLDDIKKDNIVNKILDENEPETEKDAQAKETESKKSSLFAERFRKKQTNKESVVDANEKERTRRTTEANNGVSNLSFNVGKDISDDKKKLFRIE